MRNTILQQQGFTLIEALIALFVLMVGVLGLSSMQITGINGNATATKITWGTAWVTDQIEYLINQPYDDIVLDDTTATAAHGPVTSPDGKYNITWTVDEDLPMENLKSITITVQYPDGGTQKSIVMNYVKPRM